MKRRKGCIVNTVSFSCETAGTSALAPRRGCRRLILGQGGKGRPASRPADLSRPMSTPSQCIAAATAFVLCCVVGVAVTIGANALSAQKSAQALAGIQTQTVTVAPGDSLSSIADEHGVRGLDNAQMVDWLVSINGLSSSMLRVGQTLVVPA